MKNRTSKQVSDIMDFVLEKWDLSINEEELLDSLLFLFSERDIEKQRQLTHLVNDETEEVLKLLNDREVIDYVTENWNFIASDDEYGLEEALDDLGFNWIEKVTDTDMINYLENDGWSVEYDHKYPKHQNDIITCMQIQEMTDLFLNLSPQKREEIINTLN